MNYRDHPLLSTKPDLTKYDQVRADACRVTNIIDFRHANESDRSPTSELQMRESFSGHVHPAPVLVQKYDFEHIPENCQLCINDSGSVSPTAHRLPVTL